MPDGSNIDTSGGDNSDTDTDTTRIVSDNEPYRDNISDTANTVSNTPPISQSVQSSPCQIGYLALLLSMLSKIIFTPSKVPGSSRLSHFYFACCSLFN